MRPRAECYSFLTDARGAGFSKKTCANKPALLGKVPGSVHSRGTGLMPTLTIVEAASSRRLYYLGSSLLRMRQVPPAKQPCKREGQSRNFQPSCILRTSYADQHVHWSCVWENDQRKSPCVAVWSTKPTTTNEHTTPCRHGSNRDTELWLVYEAGSAPLCIEYQHVVVVWGGPVLAEEPSCEKVRCVVISLTNDNHVRARS